MDRSAVRHRDRGQRSGLPVSAAVVAETAVEEQLAGQIQRALSHTGYGALKRIEIAIDRGHVTLRGPVRSFYQKQVATSVILPMEGVVQLSNELTVTR